jgi:uncharacterized protein (DUF2147 family)
VTPAVLRALRSALPLSFALSASAFGVIPAYAEPVPLSSVIGPSALGTWKTQEGDEITVAPCGGDLCGTLSYIIIPKKNAADCRSMDHQAFGALMLDYSNPDKAKQTRPLLGVQMMSIKTTTDPNTYTASVYNPQDGSTNDIQVFILNGGSTLRVGGGCIGSMCAVTQDWPKVPDRADAPNFTCEGGH